MAFRWNAAITFSLAFLLVSFAPGEAEGATAERNLGEGMMLGGDDLSKLSYLMDSTNEANLQNLLNNLASSTVAAGLGQLSKNAVALEKLADASTVTKLTELANKPPAETGSDGTDGVNGPPGEAGDKGDVGDAGMKGDRGKKGEAG